MAKPITPYVGSETFVLNELDQVFLVKRMDNGTWCMPGGAQDLGETPKQCAIREFKEESGYDVQILDIVGVFSSLNYKYVHYQWKENEFVHILFYGKIVSGAAEISNETTAVGWFSVHELPLMMDGHTDRILKAYDKIKNKKSVVYFE
ncbi:MAG: NUDIX domain-containing protein [Pseudobdellovibrio sp.]